MYNVIDLEGKKVMIRSYIHLTTPCDNYAVLIAKYDLNIYVLGKKFKIMCFTRNKIKNANTYHVC